MSRGWPEAIRRRRVAEALRLFARLVVEHERVRRLSGAAVTAKYCRPSPAVWGLLREIALFSGLGRRVAPLTEFFSLFHEGAETRGAASAAPARGVPKGVEAPPRVSDAEAVPERVPCAAYLGALRVAVELAGDAVVQNGGEPPWATGEPRAPESAEAFEALCRELRDRDEEPSEFGSLAAILDAADLRPVPPAARRVVFDAAEYILVIGDVAIALPEGQERDFFRSLITASKVGRVTPVEEHGRVWKGAVDRIRKRIQKATGRARLREVLISAKRPVCGYRLNPNVEVRFASEAGLRFLSPEVLDALAHPAGRGRRRPPREDD